MRDNGLLLIVIGLILGAAGDALLHVPAAPALNLFVWLALVAVAARVVTTRAARAREGQLSWLALAVVFAAALVWRDAPALKLLALGAVTLSFALAAYRPTTEWIRYSGVSRYAAAWAMGALHAWTASAFVLIEAIRAPRPEMSPARGWRVAMGVVRGLVIAAPLLVVFGGLFMAADAVFSHIVLSIVRIDLSLVASHIMLAALAAWLATGYLRGFLAGTERPLLTVVPDGDQVSRKRVTLSITEVATVMGAINLLFALFVVVQFRYLFGGESLIHMTPDLTYAEYARRGFFELVFAVFLVMPVLLAADWLLDPGGPRDNTAFRTLAGVQIALVLAIATSALERLRLYYETYGLTEARFYAMTLLLWIGMLLLWLAATVLRGRRQAFAFGALASALAVVVLLFAVSPDALVARTNVGRMTSASAAPFDAVYASTLSADAVPVLLDALSALPREAQCPLARHMLVSWASDRRLTVRGWNWSAARASRAVRAHESELRSILGPDQTCSVAGG